MFPLCHIYILQISTITTYWTTILGVSITGDIQNPVLASRVPGYCTPQKPVAPAFTDVKKPENQDASGNYGYAIAAKMFV